MFSLVKSAVNIARICCSERRAAAPLLHAGRRRPPLSIDMSRLRRAQQQTRRTPRRLSNDETDRRTSDRYIDPASHTGSVNNVNRKQAISDLGVRRVCWFAGAHVTKLTQRASASRSRLAAVREL